MSEYGNSTDFYFFYLKRSHSLLYDFTGTFLQISTQLCWSGTSWILNNLSHTRTQWDTYFLYINTRTLPYYNFIHQHPTWHSCFLQTAIPSFMDYLLSHRLYSLQGRLSRVLGGCSEEILPFILHQVDSVNLAFLNVMARMNPFWFAG